MVSLIPIRTWERIGFTREDLLPTNLRLAVTNRGAIYVAGRTPITALSKHKADIGCCNFVEHEIKLQKGAVPHREGARRMKPHESEACRAEKEMLLEYGMIEPSKSPWACRIVMAKKKGAASVMLRLSLLERSDNKRCTPLTANRRDPLETW